MAYDYSKKELYDRAFFSLIKGAQEISVVFDYDGVDSDYNMFIWCETGGMIEDPEEEEFQETLTEIMVNFDNGRDLDIQVYQY
jgi:hypothetical protein